MSYTVGTIVYHRDKRVCGVVTRVVDDSRVQIAYRDHIREVVTTDVLRNCENGFYDGCLYVQRQFNLVFNANHEYLGHLSELGIGNCNVTPREYVDEYYKSFSIQDFEPLFVFTEPRLPDWANGAIVHAVSIQD